MSDNESVPDPEASRAEPEVEGGDAGQETAAGSGQETATVSSGIIHLSDNAKLDIIEKIGIFSTTIHFKTISQLFLFRR